MSKLAHAGAKQNANRRVTAAAKPSRTASSIESARMISATTRQLRFDIVRILADQNEHRTEDSIKRDQRSVRSIFAASTEDQELFSLRRRSSASRAFEVASTEVAFESL